MKFVQMTGRDRSRSVIPTHASSTSSHPSSAASISLERGLESSSDAPGTSDNAGGAEKRSTALRAQRAAPTDTLSRIGSEPTRPLRQNLGDQAVCFFFHQYIISANEGGNPGYLDFLPGLYEKSNPDGALAVSIKAISYASLSAKSSIKVLVAKSHEHYQATLHLVNGMLQSPEEIAQDSLIVAILLLVLFEVCFLQSLFSV
jgi:hypothetical protein